jgi:phosphatidylglycerophosphate synthase
MRLATSSLLRMQCSSRLIYPIRGAPPSSPLARCLSNQAVLSKRTISPPLPSPRNYPGKCLSLLKSYSSPFISRFRPFSTPVKRERHENIYTLPNILTFTRLLSTPVIAYLILHDKPYLATSLLFYAGLTDLIDGYIARKYNLKSVLGTILDPMADKFLMITLTGALAYTGALPCNFTPRKVDVVWLGGIILGRDVGLGFAALYYRYISLPPPKTFLRFWDFSLPSAEVHPTTISKVFLSLYC